MDEKLTFIGVFRIPDLPAWTSAIGRMTEFVATNVPRIESFHAYADAAGMEGTVVYVHPDADSFDQHLAAASEQIDAGTAMVEVIRIELLGSPHAGTVDRLRQSGPPVTVKAHVRGFSR